MTDMAPIEPSGPCQVVRLVLDIANGRHRLAKLVAPTLFLADALLCVLVICKIPYTEIDWTAYMEQVQQYIDGERDYTKIVGGTGPLVYPAAHVYIFTGLYYLTGRGKNILLAQQVFAVLYLASLALVMACYRNAKAPPYVMPLLVASMRLHSIFMLRCFNDCVAVFLLWLAIFLLQRRQGHLAVLVYSCGLGVKMSLLLVLPALGIILFLLYGARTSLLLAQTIAHVQGLLGIPFIRENGRGYFGRAFELSRRFLFSWTVNWRFVGEQVFVSVAFSRMLLGLHVAVLWLFITTRWLKPSGSTLRDMMLRMLQRHPPLTAHEEKTTLRNLTPSYILTSMLTANVVGLLFARSLHYQFYAYLAWSTPFLLWRSGVHPVVQYSLWLAQEAMWFLVFPSTSLSSAVVVAVMAATVALVWWGAKEDFEAQAHLSRDKPAAAKR